MVKMKILSDKVAESILGAIAILSVCAILAALPAFFPPKELHLGAVPYAAVWVMLFPFLLLFRLWPAIDQWHTVVPFAAVFGFVVSLAIWTAIIHGLRLVFANRRK